MMMNPCWDRNTRGRWFRPAWLILVFLLALPSVAQTLDVLVRAYRKRPSAAGRTALLRYANAHPKDLSGALALLVVGATEAEGDHPAEAIPLLEAAKARLSKISDYPAYYLAEALHGAKKYGEAITQLETVLRAPPASPLRTRAILLAGQIYLDSGTPAQGVKLLRENLAPLPQPEGIHLLAQCLEAAGEPAAAAAAYQRIYYEYPMAREARDAATALARLRRRLRSGYPPVLAQAMFTRVERLIRAGQHLTARKELQRMTTTLGGADRERARVWLGKARYIRHHDTIAYRWLRSLKVIDPDVDAERLYYLLASARRLGRKTEVARILQQLKQKHPASRWRLEALVSAGNQYLLLNQPEKYEPIYRACADAFPAAPEAAYCDWKVAWSHYVRRRPDAAELLRAHLEKFPASEKASAALYFLGRLAERAGDKAAARTYYYEIKREYPNFYYAGRARDRLRAGEVEAAGESAEVSRFLAGIDFPPRRHKKNFQPTPATELRLERARLLLSAGLDDWGERELEFGARTDGDAAVLAMELARSAAGRGQHGQSIRYIKALAAGYLSMPLEAAPEKFWRLAFPLPYRDQLEKYARRRDLDLYFLAALVRQESEFDPRAVSRARAYGLTQILPATGRQLSRKLGIRHYRTSLLYQPDINLNMGTYYLRTLIDELDGHTEAALASYNAGKSRAKAWLGWADYREPAEYVETVPFTETRNYIQTVLRNADIYRRLYGPAGAVRASN